MPCGPLSARIRMSSSSVRSGTQRGRKTEVKRLNGFNLFDVKGCESCAYTGYRGRTGIFEFLKVNDEIQRLILEKKGSQVIKEAARKQGMRTLREDGWMKVRQGMTTVSEVLR